MASVHEISEQVQAYLARRLSLEALEDWSVEYSWDIHKRADEETRALAYQVRAILNAHSDDASEDGLCQGLAEAIRPFARPIRVYAPAKEVRWGNPSFKSAITDGWRDYPAGAVA